MTLVTDARDPAEPDDEVAKIARLATARGYWDARAALEGAAMARLHAAGPRVFLKKLLERKCGLTYDEVARLEKDALAPPVATTPSKPLPRLGVGAKAEPAGAAVDAVPESRHVVSDGKLPSLDAARPAVTASPEVSPIVPGPKLPSLDTPRAAPRPEPADRGETLTPKKPLPRLNAPRRKPTEEPPGPGTT